MTFRNRILAFPPPDRPRPTPRCALVNRLKIGGVVTTAVSRTWDGDDGRRCRLCPRSRCTLDDHGLACLVLVEGEVSRDEALHFEPAGMVAVAPGCYRAGKGATCDS